MTNKEEAYRLFNEGKRPSDDELKDLGLKQSTVFRYFQAWKKQASELEPATVGVISSPVTAAIEPTVAPEESLLPEIVVVPSPPVIEVPTPVETPVESLLLAQQFMLNGERYRVADKTPECVVCNRLRFLSTGPLLQDNIWHVVGRVSLATNTMVELI